MVTMTTIQSTVVFSPILEKMGLKPGLHIIRKDRKHGLENMFFKLSSCGLVSIW